MLYVTVVSYIFHPQLFILISARYSYFGYKYRPAVHARDAAFREPAGCEPSRRALDTQRIRYGWGRSGSTIDGQTRLGRWSHWIRSGLDLTPKDTDACGTASSSGPCRRTLHVFGLCLVWPVSCNVFVKRPRNPTVTSMSLESGNSLQAKALPLALDLSSDGT
jgi:hypothetical protein